MKAAFVENTRKIQIKQIPTPQIADDEVLIKVHYVGVCGSDLHLFNGTHPFRRPPAILGHEIAGEIIELGPLVSDLRVGDRVTVEPHIGCEKCEFCKTGNMNLCKSKKAPGTPSWIGTFCEYFNAPARFVHRLDDSVSYQIGVLAEPFAVAVHAVNKITEHNRDSILILGAGTIGLLTLVAAREAGYKTIICTDTQPFNLEAAIKEGAAHVINPLHEDVAQKVLEITSGTGVDVAIIAAGSPDIIDQASSAVKKTGQIGLVSMITERIPVYTYNFVFNEQTLFGAMTYRPIDFKQSVDMINRGLDLKRFITQEFDLEHAQEALDTLADKKVGVIKVLVRIS